MASGEFGQDWLTLSRTQPELEHNIIHDTVDEFTGIKNLEATAGPFVMDTHQWTALSLKRMVRWAADNDFDSIGWTTGKMQADRYNLRKHVNEVSAMKNTDGTYQLAAEDKRGLDMLGMSGKRVTAEEMEKYIVEEVEEKLIK